MQRPICPVCEKGEDDDDVFESWIDVASHLVKKHNWSPVQCVCGKRFPDEGWCGSIGYYMSDHLRDQKDVILHVALERIGRKKKEPNPFYSASGFTVFSGHGPIVYPHSVVNTVTI
jgi:hypothetical protein